jgi:hypothetical protein
MSLSSCDIFDVTATFFLVTFLIMIFLLLVDRFMFADEGYNLEEGIHLFRICSHFQGSSSFFPYCVYCIMSGGGFC